jgi:hypothetical protein
VELAGQGQLAGVNAFVLRGIHAWGMSARLAMALFSAGHAARWQVRGMVPDPGAAMFFHPNLDGPLPAEVVTRFLGLEPLEFQKFLAFFEEGYCSGSPTMGLPLTQK